MQGLGAVAGRYDGSALRACRCRGRAYDAMRGDPGTKAVGRASAGVVSSTRAAILVSTITLAACTEPPARPLADRWAPRFASLRPPVAVGTDADPLARLIAAAGPIVDVGAWEDRVHPCARDVPRPPRVCVPAALEAPDVAVRSWWASLRRRGRAHRGALGPWLEISPAALEAVTDGVLRFEVEHSTAGAGDCAWILRERGSNRVLFHVHDVRDEVDWCR